MIDECYSFKKVLCCGKSSKVPSSVIKTVGKLTQTVQKVADVSCIQSKLKVDTFIKTRIVAELLLSCQWITK